MKPLDPDLQELLKRKTLRVVRRVQIIYEFYDGDSQVGVPTVMFNGFLDEATEDGPTMRIEATAVAVLLQHCEGCRRGYPKNEAGQHVWPSGIGGGDFRECQK